MDFEGTQLLFPMSSHEPANNSGGGAVDYGDLRASRALIFDQRAVDSADGASAPDAGPGGGR